MGKYRTIVADPPWDYREGFVRGPNAGFGWTNRHDLPYGSLSIEDIAALPVPEFADPTGAFLFLWTTNRYLPDSFDVLSAWGFRYRQTIVWHKDDASPFPGAVAPNEAEFLLAGRRVGVRRSGTWPEAIVTANRGTHSAKPEVFLDMVEHVAPGPYLELFARRARFGWDYWGDQSLGTAEIPTAT